MDFIIADNVDFESLINRNFNESVGKPNLGGNFGSCEVKILGHEGPTPHVHIVAKNGSKKVMVRLMSAEYEVHKGEKQEAFDKDASEAFNDFMHKETFDKDAKITTTYWDIARRLWIRQCTETPRKMVDELANMTEIPDYSKLPTKLPKKN